MTTPLSSRILLAAFAFVSLSIGFSGCIERPYADSPQQSRSSFDRGSVRDALLPGVPADTIPVGAVFDNSAELVGYRVEPAALVPGQRARITLFWRCRREMNLWHIFVHLDDATGASPERIHAEHDPVQGRFPTDAWRPGDLIADSFIIQVGQVPLSLFLGFYAQGETRLPLDSPGRGRDDGANRLWVGNIPLVQ